MAVVSFPLDQSIQINCRLVTVTNVAHFVIQIQWKSNDTVCTGGREGH
jgi:hypothetical protein